MHSFLWSFVLKIFTYWTERERKREEEAKKEVFYLITHTPILAVFVRLDLARLKQ